MRNKAELRKEILQFRDELSIEVRQEKSSQIAEQVTAHKGFQEADKVLLFASFKSEVDTTEIFEAALQIGKQVFFPKVIGKEMEFYQVLKEKDLIEGYHGIREPKAEEKKKFVPMPEEKIFILMPGTVFDEAGGRIGYGGGYYDKFIQRLETEIPKENLCTLAVAFECQMAALGEIPREEHDMKPDYIVTETRNITIQHKMS